MKITISFNCAESQDCHGSDVAWEKFKEEHVALLQMLEDVTDALIEGTKKIDAVSQGKEPLNVKALPELMGKMYADIVNLSLYQGMLLNALEAEGIEGGEDLEDSMDDFIEAIGCYLDHAAELLMDAAFGGGDENDDISGEGEQAEDFAVDENEGPTVLCEIKGTLSEEKIEALFNTTEVSQAIQALIDAIYGNM